MPTPCDPPTSGLTVDDSIKMVFLFALTERVVSWTLPQGSLIGSFLLCLFWTLVSTSFFVAGRTLPALLTAWSSVRCGGECIAVVCRWFFCCSLRPKPRDEVSMMHWNLDEEHENEETDSG